MAGAKVVVLYPQPTDLAAFDRRYAAEHVPMVCASFPTMTAFHTTRVLGAPQGAAPYYWLAELHFASQEALQAALGTEAARATVGHALELSTGGPMTILICEEAREQNR